MNTILKDALIAATGLVVGYFIGRKIREKIGPEEIDEKVDKAVNWVKENKEIAIAAMPVGLAVIKSISKAVQSLERRQEEELRERRIFDHSSGKWIHLKRKMKAIDHLEFDQRKRQGQTTTQALSEMGLLY